MPRPLVELHDVREAEYGKDQQGTTARTAARAFAAALSVLLVATMVISRSNDALTTDGTLAKSTVSSGTVSLTDDDSGRSLFDLSDMAPNRPISRCIEVIYEGTILPVDLAMLGEVDGALGPFLDVTVEEGTGGGFDSCSEFAATDRIYQGTLSDLAASGWLRLGQVVNTGAARSFRITIDLKDERRALGLTATADFIWEVTPT